MSRWRRIAIDAAPSCRKVIETAKDPSEMWANLGLEYIRAKTRQPPEVIKLKELFDFAVAVKSWPRQSYLQNHVWKFFGLKNGIETMPSFPDFLLAHAYSDDFLCLLWDEFLGAYSNYRDAGGEPDLRKMQEILAFVENGEFPGDPWLFTHRFAGMFSSGDHRHMGIFARMISPETFHCWLGGNDMDKAEQLQVTERFRRARFPTSSKEKRK